MRVIGLGNRMRGDDGVGLRLVEALAARGLDGVEAVLHEGADALTLAEDLVGHDLPSVVVDCATLGDSSEQAWVAEEELRLRGLEGSVSAHGLGFGTALGVARGLGFSSPLRFFLVAPHSLDGDALSPRLEARLPSLVDRLEFRVRGFASHRGGGGHGA